jgi:hypothetical protein
MIFLKERLLMELKQEVLLMKKLMSQELELNWMQLRNK